MTIVLRSRGDPSTLAVPLRAAIRQIDAELALVNVRTLEAAAYEQGWYLRVFGTVFLIFAGGALLLASIGIYAVVAQTTARRTQEIGVRMAMGASARRVVRDFVSDTMRIILAGAAIGWLLAFAVSLQAVGDQQIDVAVFAGVPAVLLSVAAFACWLPAHRAARLDPWQALR